MKVAKWGNSLAIRLPAAVVEALGLKEGDDIEVRVSKESAIDLMRRPSLEDDVAFWKSLQGTLPADYKFNRDEIYDDE